MPCRHVLSCRFTVCLLIVEEDVSTECPEKRTLFKSAKKERFVNSDTPGAQCPHDALMCGRSPRRYQGGPDQITVAPLNLMDNRKEGLERPASQRNSCCCRLIFFKRDQSLRFEYPFGIVREQHGVTVKGDPQLVRCIVRGI